MEQEVLRLVATVGGTGGVLAVLMFYFYSKEAQGHTKRQEEYINALAAQNKQLIQVVTDNTAAMTAAVEATSSLKNVVAEMARDFRERDQYFREHVMPRVAARR